MCPKVVIFALCCLPVILVPPLLPSAVDVWFKYLLGSKSVYTASLWDPEILKRTRISLKEPSWINHRVKTQTCECESKSSPLTWGKLSVINVIDIFSPECEKIRKYIYRTAIYIHLRRIGNSVLWSPDDVLQSWFKQ